MSTKTRFEKEAKVIRKWPISNIRCITQIRRDKNYQAMEEISIKLKGRRVPVDQISKLKAGAFDLGKPYE